MKYLNTKASKHIPTPHFYIVKICTEHIKTTILWLTSILRKNSQSRFDRLIWYSRIYLFIVLDRLGNRYKESWQNVANYLGNTHYSYTAPVVYALQMDDGKYRFCRRQCSRVKVSMKCSCVITLLFKAYSRIILCPCHVRAPWMSTRNI